MKLACNIEPVEIRHLKIQQDHVRRVALNAFQGLFSGSCLATDLPRALLLQNGSKVVTNRRVVINHKDANHARAFRVNAVCADTLFPERVESVTSNIKGTPESNNQVKPLGFPGLTLGSTF